MEKFKNELNKIKILAVRWVALGEGGFGAR